MEPYELHTDRLRLSVPTEADVEAIVAYCQDPDVVRWTTVPTPYTQADGLEYVTGIVPTEWASGASRIWQVRDRETGSVLGGMDLRLQDGPPGVRAGSVGYLVAPWARRRGVMTEALRAVLAHALSPTDGETAAASDPVGESCADPEALRALYAPWAPRVVGDAPAGLGLARVVWEANVGNWPSWRTAWRCGFRLEGTLRAQGVQRGRRPDGWIGTILPGDRLEPAVPWDGPPR